MTHVKFHLLKFHWSPARDHGFRHGFTLVELAIVITIIGLLIGGVLKGQELLLNARILSFSNSTNQISTAVTTFRDIYKAYPGDITQPSSFIQNCTTAPCNYAGNGDGNIGPLQTAGYAGTPATLENETRSFWLHLANAGLLNAITPGYTGTPNTYGVDAPATALGGGFMVGSYTGTDTTFKQGFSGPYLAARNGFNTALLSAGSGLLTQKEALMVDLKMDDGQPATGRVIGMQVQYTSCTAWSGSPMVLTYYLGAASSKDCILMISLY